MQVRGSMNAVGRTGKTTLMNTLAGKASYGKRRGVIEVNGQRDALGRYARVMGFVPQVRAHMLAVRLLSGGRLHVSMKLI